MRLASRFGYANQIRRDRPLTHEELMHYVPSIFGEDRHTSRSKRYAYIPTITVLESLQRDTTTSKADSRLRRRSSVARVRSPKTCATTVLRILSYA